MYNGQDGALVYMRSLDGGENWQAQTFSDLDTSHFAGGFDADRYSIDARGNQVAFAMFNGLSDSFIMTSEDNGETWSYETMVDFPVDNYVVDSGDLLDASIADDVDEFGAPMFFNTDGSGDLVIDEEGTVHVFFGAMYYADNDLTDGISSFYPYTNGLEYWRSDMGPDSSQTIAYAYDVDGNGSLDFYDEIASYFVGISSQASACVIEGSQTIAVTYSALMENISTGIQNVRHVYLVHSDDLGATWNSESACDLTPDEDGNLYEHVFPHVPARSSGPVLPVLFQRDFEPGLHVQGDLDPIDVNEIIVLQVLTNALGECSALIGTNEGCTVASACNYSPVATADDGSCVYPAEPWLDCNGQCLQDLDGNGVCDDLEGSILFQEDFANGFAGNNGVGPLVAEDTSPSTTIWQWVDPNGDGYYPDGSASGVQPPAGEFSTNIGALGSATADNGWVIFDGDYYNTPISSGVEDVEGTLSLPTLDFSGVTSVVIEWDQYFRYCCYPLAPFFLEVSSDGGATWTSFEAKGEFLESTNTASANPLHTTVDIGCAAAGASAVDIRFAWRQHPDYGNGYSHYYWGLDDIVIRENPLSIGMEIAHVFTGDVVNDFAYSIVPLSQAVSTGDGGLLAQVHHRNTGNIDLPGAVIDIDILDSIGQVVYSTQTAPFVSVAQANGATCPSEDIAVLDIPTGWVPDEVGEYTVRATLTAPEYPNAVPVEQSIRFTECRFGHDDAAALDEVMTPIVHDDVPDLFDPTGYGSRFTFEEAGQHVYGIEVAFGPELGHELQFEIRWIEQDPTTSLTDSPHEFAEFVTDSAWGSSPEAPEFTALYFEQPISVNASSFYAAAVITEFEWEESLEVLANADSDFDESTIVYLQSGSGEFVWFAGQSSTPAIRLITCVPEPIEGCTDPEATNYDPFATVDDGNCAYPVSGCTDPEAVNYDPVAVIDDGSCVFDLGCPDIGSGAFDGQPLALYPAQSMGMAGIPMYASVALHVPSSIVEDGTGTVYAVHSFVPSGFGGDDLPGITLPTLPGTMEGNQQACLDLVGTPMSAGLFQIEVVGDLYISVFGSPFLAGEFTLLHTVVIEPNPNPIEGCMYVGATNYSPLATVDMGGCIIPGCMAASAVNYHPVFTQDDGTCVFADDLGGSQCPSDLNGDDLVGVGDLLILLGEFGSTCTP